mgnify:CR=1 FL=1
MKVITITELKRLLDKPILFDASIFMIGIKKRATDPNFSFSHLKDVFIQPLIDSFAKIMIHADVYDELVDECKNFLGKYIGNKIVIVDKERNYRIDPQYNRIFNLISDHELFRLKTKQREHLGEISSLSYACLNGINYFCANDGGALLAVDEIDALNRVRILPFDTILLLAYYVHNKKGNKDHNKTLKSLYKEFARRKNRLPDTFKEYLELCFK